jgi:GTP-binding protein LepA
VLTLCNERRGQQAELTYVGNRAMAVYRLPLNEVVFDFYDRLKSISRGYASFDYVGGWLPGGDLVKISDPGQRGAGGRAVLHGASQPGRPPRPADLREAEGADPPPALQDPIQAAIGGRVIARETISAMSKDVTAKCYGGDISRKRKLLDKQKEGKKRMRQFGKVEIPQSAFIAALKMDA